MASLESLVQSKKSQVDQRARAVVQIESMIADFERLAANLELEIRSEEDRTKNHDPSHFAYSTLAKANIQRRDNLKQSIDKLRVQLSVAQGALQKSSEELEAATRLAAAEQIRGQSDILEIKRRTVIGDLNYVT
jgi:flagellar FliJ protein